MAEEMTVVVATAAGDNLHQEPSSSSIVAGDDSDDDQHDDKNKNVCDIVPSPPTVTITETPVEMMAVESKDSGEQPDDSNFVSETKTKQDDNMKNTATDDDQIPPLVSQTEQMMVIKEDESTIVPIEPDGRTGVSRPDGEEPKSNQTTTMIIDDTNIINELSDNKPPTTDDNPMISTTTSASNELPSLVSLAADAGAGPSEVVVNDHKDDIKNEEFDLSNLKTEIVDYEGDDNDAVLLESSSVAPPPPEPPPEMTQTQASEDLFSAIKFSLCDNVPDGDKLKKIMVSHGAKFLNYLSDSATHFIADAEDHPAVSEAVDIYEKPVVTSQWVWLSLRANHVLPIEPFTLMTPDGFDGKPKMVKFFSHVVACPSRVHPGDCKRLWSMITYYGGKFQLRLDSKCTHLVTSSISGRKYEMASKSQKIRIVSPDWVVDCCRQRKLVDETKYHPRLLSSYHQGSMIGKKLPERVIKKEPTTIAETLNPTEPKTTVTKSVTMTISTEAVVTVRKPSAVPEIESPTRPPALVSPPPLLESPPSKPFGSSSTTPPVVPQQHHPVTMNQSSNSLLASKQPRQMIQPQQTLQPAPQARHSSTMMTPMSMANSRMPSSPQQSPRMMSPQQHLQQQQQQRLPIHPVNNAKCQTTPPPPAPPPPSQLSPNQKMHSAQPPPVSPNMGGGGYPPSSMAQSQPQVQYQQQQMVQQQPRPSQQIYVQPQAQQQSMYSQQQQQYQQQRQYVRMPGHPQQGPPMMQQPQRRMLSPNQPHQSQMMNMQQQQQQQQFQQRQFQQQHLQPQQQLQQQPPPQFRPVVGPPRPGMSQQHAQMMQYGRPPPQMHPQQQQIPAGYQNRPMMVGQQQNRMVVQQQFANQNYPQQQQMMAGQDPQSMQMLRVAVPPNQQIPQSQQQRSPGSQSPIPGTYPGGQQSVGIPRQMMQPRPQRIMQPGQPQPPRMIIRHQNVPPQYGPNGQPPMSPRPPPQMQMQQPQQPQYVPRHPQQRWPQPGQQQQMTPDYMTPQQQQQYHPQRPQMMPGQPGIPQQQQQWIRTQQPQMHRYPPPQMVRMPPGGPHPMGGGMSPGGSIQPPGTSTNSYYDPMMANKVRAQTSNNNQSQQQQEMMQQQPSPIIQPQSMHGGSGLSSPTVSSPNTSIQQQQQQFSNKMIASPNPAVTTPPAGGGMPPSSAPSVVNEKTKTALANLLNNRLNLQLQRNGGENQMVTGSGNTPTTPSSSSLSCSPCSSPSQQVMAPATTSTAAAPGIKMAASGGACSGGGSNSPMQAMNPMTPLGADHPSMYQQQPSQQLQPSPFNSGPPNYHRLPPHYPQAPSHQHPASPMTPVVGKQAFSSTSSMQQQVSPGQPVVPPSPGTPVHHAMIQQQQRPLQPFPNSQQPHPPQHGYPPMHQQQPAPHHPMVQQSPQFAQPPQQQQQPLQHLPLAPHQPIRFYGLEQKPGVTVSPDSCLIGCTFYLAPTYTENPATMELVPGWKHRLEQYGGRVVDDLSQSPVTHVVTEHMNLPAKKSMQAIQQQDSRRRYVSIFWLDDVLQQHQLLPPWKFYHLPVAFNLVAAPCKHHIISITNFDQEERSMIKHLIIRTGAKYTDYLSQHNTVLICKRPEGVKYRKALQWQIATVNIAWLQDVLFGNADIINAFNSLPKKYKLFDSGSSQPSGNTRTGNNDTFRVEYGLIPGLMIPWRVPIQFDEEELKRHEEKVKEEKEKQRKQQEEEDKVQQQQQEPPKNGNGLEKSGQDEEKKLNGNNGDSHEAETNVAPNITGTKRDLEESSSIEEDSDVKPKIPNGDLTTDSATTTDSLMEESVGKDDSGPPPLKRFKAENENSNEDIILMDTSSHGSSESATKPGHHESGLSLKSLLNNHEENSCHTDDSFTTANNEVNGDSGVILVNGSDSNATTNSSSNTNNNGGNHERGSGKFKVPFDVKKLSPPTILLSGIRSQKMYDHYRWVVESLGGKLVQDFGKVTHLVVGHDYALLPDVSINFLCAFARAQHMVTSDWLDDSQKMERFVPEVQYQYLDDPKRCMTTNQSEYELDLADSWRRRQPDLFRDIIFLLTPSLIPRPSILKHVCEANGGHAVVKRMPNRRQLNDILLRQKKRFVVITCDNDVHILSDYLVQCPQVEILNADFIVDSILKQQIKFEPFRLLLPSRPHTTSGGLGAGNNATKPTTSTPSTTTKDPNNNIQTSKPKSTTTNTEIAASI